MAQQLGEQPLVLRHSHTRWSDRTSSRLETREGVPFTRFRSPSLTPRVEAFLLKSTLVEYQKKSFVLLFVVFLCVCVSVFCFFVFVRLCFVFCFLFGVLCILFSDKKNLRSVFFALSTSFYLALDNRRFNPHFYSVASTIVGPATDSFQEKNEVPLAFSRKEPAEFKPFYEKEAPLSPAKRCPRNLHPIAISPWVWAESAPGDQERVFPRETVFTLRSLKKTTIAPPIIL